MWSSCCTSEICASLGLPTARRSRRMRDEHARGHRDGRPRAPRARTIGERALHRLRAELEAAPREEREERIRREPMLGAPEDRRARPDPRRDRDEEAEREEEIRLQ